MRNAKANCIRITLHFALPMPNLDDAAFASREMHDYSEVLLSLAIRPFTFKI
jgi:hypothetical protein